MAIRKLLNGEPVEELDLPIDLIIHTKCPEKYILIDLETGQKYRGGSKPNLYGLWERLNENDIKEDNL
jgi:hypothetical protein